VEKGLNGGEKGLPWNRRTHVRYEPNSQRSAEAFQLPAGKSNYLLANPYSLPTTGALKFQGETEHVSGTASLLQDLFLKKNQFF